MSDHITFKRILKWGFINFFRNGVISAANVLVMSLSIFMIGSVIVGSAFLSGIITNLEEKVDISVYFKTDAQEGDIVELKKDLEKLPEIKSVNYISSEESLKLFQEKHKDDKTSLEALELIGENPFAASLEITAKDTSKYESISKFLEKGSYDEIIGIDSAGRKKITYRQNQFVIDKLSGILRQVRIFGLGLSIVLMMIAVLVAYNTIRLAIYNAKDEISVMQLVGASRMFIRGPFLIEGIMHGVIATIFTLSVLYPLMWWVGMKTSVVFGGLNIFQYFQSNLIILTALLLATGTLLGVISAGVAMRKYLKV